MPQSKYDLLHYDGSGIVADVKERSLAVGIEVAAAVGISQEKVKNVKQVLPVHPLIIQSFLSNFHTFFIYSTM